MVKNLKDPTQIMQLFVQRITNVEQFSAFRFRMKANQETKQYCMEYFVHSVLHLCVQQALETYADVLKEVWLERRTLQGGGFTHP